MCFELKSGNTLQILRLTKKEFNVYRRVCVGGVWCSASNIRAQISLVVRGVAGAPFSNQKLNAYFSAVSFIEFSAV